jgi:hypothetical protein
MCSYVSVFEYVKTVNAVHTRQKNGRQQVTQTRAQVCANRQQVTQTRAQVCANRKQVTQTRAQVCANRKQ